MAARRKNRAKMNIPMCLACVLLCLTLVSVRLSSGVVARYTTNTDSGDSARVIKFGDLTLTETGGGYIAPGVTLKWNARVSFEGSESATYVFVEVSGVHAGDASTVTLFNGGPSWSVVTGADGWTYLGAYDGGGTHVYYRALAPNATMTNVPLFKSDTVEIADTVTADQIAAIGSASPKFRASVVQSNGFANAGAAWTSLETKHP